MNLLLKLSLTLISYVGVDHTFVLKKIGEIKKEPPQKHAIINESFGILYLFRCEYV